MEKLHTESYIRDTKSPWLVFLHGFGGSVKMWKRQLTHFKERYNLLLIDLPGHGESTEGIHGKHITKFEGIADIIVDTLGTQGIKHATFMCVSLGSLIFASILSKYPELVDGAILCGAISGMNLFYKSILMGVSKIKFMLPYMTILTAFAYVLMPYKEHKKSREFFIKSGKLLGRDEFMAWFNLFVKDMNVLKNLENFKKNILFVMGNEDFVFLSGIKKKYSQVKNTKLKILDHCGHVCNIQKWNEFNRVSSEYIESLENIH